MQTNTDGMGYFCDLNQAEQSLLGLHCHDFFILLHLYLSTLKAPRKNAS